MTLLTFLRSMQKRKVVEPSGCFFLTSSTGERHGLHDGRMIFYSSMSSTCLVSGSRAIDGMGYWRC